MPPPGSPQASRTVLVTGGAGFIGSHLVDALVARGDRVLVVDDLSHGSRDNLVASLPHVEVLETDVARAGDSVRAALRGAPLDAVIHLASLISSHDSLLEPRRYFDANIGGLLEMLDVARSANARCFVFASSSTVYGDTQRDACRESDLPAPQTVYAATKLAGEHLCAMYAARDGFTACSLRLFNVYGPRQSPKHAYANVVCHFLHAAARSEGITLYGDGRQTRDFVFIDDAVRALVRASEATCTGVVNVGTGQTTSIEELVHRIEALARGPLARTMKPPWANDIRHIRADVTRMRDELGLVSTVDLGDGLARTLASIRGARP